jgi:hypothetical protein
MVHPTCGVSSASVDDRVGRRELDMSGTMLLHSRCSGQGSQDLVHGKHDVQGNGEEHQAESKDDRDSQ